MMRRFLCFSLCLGLMVSACKKKSLEESVNKAIAKAGGGGGGDEATAVTKKDKEAVLKACLPLINSHMKGTFGKVSADNFFLRRSTAWKPTAAEPLVVLYTSEGMPLEFTEEHGLGKDAAAVTKNLNEMAASKVIQDQFVARANNASGWRVHISKSNADVEIPGSEENAAPVVPESHKGKIIIYDRENAIHSEGRTVLAAPARDDLNQANHPILAGDWFECVVNDTTEAVTLEYTRQALTAS